MSQVIDADNEVRLGTQVAELTGLLDRTGFLHNLVGRPRWTSAYGDADLGIFDTIEGFQHHPSICRDDVVVVRVQSTAKTGEIVGGDVRRRGGG